ncbi:hypothetical protein [Helicobacter mehlei]|uniref:Uncharacterized protein n=1 Tax=Helicobacter mehlei TaxID=2316080 RepID=A0A553UX12_9HELI|nr:hypothetical protein [Helicobacter mehlei]TSA84736.1 hypothetical protein FNE76_03985 [Helicobacter mehlei]
MFRIMRTFWLLCFLANVAWGLECNPDQATALKAQAQAFIKMPINPEIRLDQNYLIDPNQPKQVAYILDVHKAYAHGALYCGFVARLFGADSLEDLESDEGSRYYKYAVMHAMCFKLTKTSKKGSSVFKGFCLYLFPRSTQLQIHVEFKKDAIILRFDDRYVECDHEHFENKKLIFKPLKGHKRYVLQTYSRWDDGVGLDPFYDQKRDGKRIFMDKIDNNVLDDLEDRCYEKGYCQTWSDKNGID